MQMPEATPYESRTIGKMNRRDFVSGGLSAIVAGSQAARPKLLAATTAQDDPKSFLTSKRIRVGLGPDGTIRSMEVKYAGEWEPVEFCTERIAGPVFTGVKLESLTRSPKNFAGTANGIRYSLRYRLQGDRLAIVAALKNERDSDYAPKAVPLVLGINCEMLSYPAWNDRYFPTLLRCEKTHFWGYIS